MIHDISHERKEMRITNKFNLPETIVRFNENSHYDSGKSNITCTQLIDSPRIVQLRKKHQNELEQDISEMLWMIMGTAMHGIFESVKVEGTIAEERLFTQLNGWDISGAIDSQIVEPDGIIIGDYKFTSVWAVMNDKPDWEYQLNIYAWLVEVVKKIPVKSLRIYAMCRDWQRRDVGKEGYPEVPLVTVEVPLWPLAQRQAYVEARLKAHADADTDATLGSDLAKCSPDDQWRRKETFAVMRNKNMSRAWRVFDSHEVAVKFAAENKDVTVITRPAEPIRCKNNFCRVSQFCSQFKDENEIL